MSVKQPHRKRIRHYHEPGDLHELTFSNCRRRPLVTNDTWRGWLAESIDTACEKQSCRLVAFVFMPEHVHLTDLANKEQKAFNPGRAEDLLEQTPTHLRGWEYHYLKRARFGPVWQLPDLTRWSFQFSRDGRKMTVLGDHGLTVWDVGLQRSIWSRPLPDRILWWSLAPRGDYLCLINTDGS